MKARHAEGKAAVLTGLLERGITPVSDYDGGYGTSAGNKVKWYNSNCGHTFESSPGNVIVKKLDCSICGAARRADINRERGVERFVEWSKTAPAWKIYRAMVTRYTTQAYKKHKELLNPNDHPIGIAGTDGAYQVDHIVSVRKCFDHRVPPALCYDASNLRVIPWLANSNKSEKFDRSIPVPTIFNEHVKDYQFVTPVNPYTHDEMLAMTNSVATQFLVEDDSDADAFFEHLDDDETDE